LSDSTFIEAVLLNGALIRARILFVETLATNNAIPSRAILATKLLTTSSMFHWRRYTQHPTNGGFLSFPFWAIARENARQSVGNPSFYEARSIAAVLKHESDFDGTWLSILTIVVM